MSAVLCRHWQTRIKGRDWYDFLWFVQTNTPLHLKHLECRLRQFGYYNNDAPLNKSDVEHFLIKRIQQLDIAQAKNDIKKFINNESDLDGWSKDLFINIAKQIVFLESA